MNFSARIITILVASVFIFQNVLADPPGSKSGGSKSSSGGSKTSSGGSKPSSGSKTTSSGSKNTGNNPGNANAPGYNSSSSSKKQSDGYKNTGNNPGNANAPGYNSSSSSKKQSDGYKNTGNNPGNSNASGYNSSSGSGNAKKSPTTNMTRAQAQDYTSALSPEGTTAAKKKSNQNAAYAGHRNAELGYKQEQPSEFYSGAGVQNEYQKDFYQGVQNYYDKNQIPKDQRSVAAGPVQAMIKPYGSTISANERKLAELLDQGYLEGKVNLSVPGKTFDGEITKQLNYAQQLALKNAVVVVANSDFISDNIIKIGADGFATDEVYVSNGVALGGLVIVSNDSFPSSVEVGSVKLATENLLAHELDHSADYVVQKLAEKELKKKNISEKDRALAKEAFDVATILNNHVLITQVENVPGPDGTVIKEETKKKIEEINPDYLKKDNNYYLRLNELQSYMSSPNFPVEDFAGQILMTSNANLTVEEANEIAKVISESPALGFINEITESFAKKQLGK